MKEEDELFIKQNTLSTEELENWLIDKYNEHKQEIDKLNNIIIEAVKKLEEYLGRDSLITDEYFERIIQLLLDDKEYIYTGYSAPDYEELKERGEI